MWDVLVDVIGVPSKLSVIRKAAGLARVSPTLDLSCEENAARRKWNGPLSELVEQKVWLQRDIFFLVLGSLVFFLHLYSKNSSSF